MLAKSKKLEVKPLGDRVIVTVESELEAGAKTKSGIYIPETVGKERKERGTVGAVGPGKLTDDGKRLQMSVKVGQVVLFTKYGPDEVLIDGTEYYILREESILAIVG